VFFFHAFSESLFTGRLICSVDYSKKGASLIRVSQTARGAEIDRYTAY
jgi:hypothetical protein